MKKILILFLILPIFGFSQEENIVQLIKPSNDPKMVVNSFVCDYIDEDVYLLNKDFVVYENCTTRKILYPDMKSFRLPKYNERNFFAFDKDGIYFRGEKIKTDTTGFKIIGKNNDYHQPEILWKTKNNAYKNGAKIEVSDVETFQAVDYFNSSYFKDKNYLYYFDKKMENSDGSSVQKYSDEFIFDKNNAYFKDEALTYKSDKIVPVNNTFLKTATVVLTRKNGNFIVQPDVDAETLKGLSKSFSIDKNKAYYKTTALPVKKENLKNIKVWEQINSGYLSDGLKVYNRDYGSEDDLDAKTFGMLPNSDFYFDKNGVYERQWVEKQQKVINAKLPFRYSKPVNEYNTFLNGSYIVYENQAYNPWQKKLYLNLTPELIKLAKTKKIRLDNENKTDITIDEEYDYILYKSGNTIYWDGKKTIADAGTFRSLNGVFYKDAKNVYNFSQGQGLLIVQGMDNESLEFYNGFLKDKDYLYFYQHQIIKSNDIEFLAVFTGYRQGCGQDGRTNSNFYLFKNSEGYWLVRIDDDVSIRNLGKILPNQEIWYPKLREKFEIR